MTAGCPVAFAIPSAKNAPARSSTCEWTASRPSRTSASTSGVEREPGDVHAWRTPLRTSSSVNARRRTWVSRSAALIGDAVGVPETVVLLHGFAGTGRRWDPVVARLDGERYRPLAPDLRGHGAASSRRPSVRRRSPGRARARRAIRSRCAATRWAAGSRCRSRSPRPSASQRLVLVATTAGIEDPAERGRRRTCDEALADATEHGSTSRRSPTAGPRSRSSRERRRRPPRLAGRHPRQRAGRARRRAARHRDRARWSRSGAGCASSRCRRPSWPASATRSSARLGERLADELPHGELVIVEGAGHGIPREDPAAVAAAIGVRRRR